MPDLRSAAASAIFRAGVPGMRCARQSTVCSRARYEAKQPNGVGSDSTFMPLGDGREHERPKDVATRCGNDRQRGALGGVEASPLPNAENGDF